MQLQARCNHVSNTSYGENAQSAQPNFSGPTKYQASQIPVLVEIYNLLQVPTTYQINSVQRTVWSTGLFDCHEDETNGWNGIFGSRTHETDEDPLFQDKPCFNNHLENMSSFLNR